MNTNINYFCFYLVVGKKPFRAIAAMAVSIIPENPSQQWKATDLELSQLHENSK